MQAIPSSSASAQQSDAVPRSDEATAFAQLLAHRQSGLTAANYERFDILADTMRPF
jgi:hypothetical protein